MEMIRRMIALNPRQTKEQTRAFVTECPLPDYDALTQSPRLKQLAERINARRRGTAKVERVFAVPLPALQPIPRQLS